MCVTVCRSVDVVNSVLLLEKVCSCLQECVLLSVVCGWSLCSWLKSGLLFKGIFLGGRNMSHSLKSVFLLA